ncbi:MAG: hypothetical protein H7145_17490 [Akkermansiaceae bacterium]|nr:hypothetical protein [Armatimonadota bacterium]
MSGEIPGAVRERLSQAIALIGSVPGYEAEAESLREMLVAGRIRYVATMEDRAHAGLLGTITLGPEPFAPGGTLLGLAETLVHERFHLTQNPLEKTVSFWAGVATKSDVMARYEKPAYQAAENFLRRFAQTFPALATESDTELFAVRSSFESSYGEVLS